MDDEAKADFKEKFTERHYENKTKSGGDSETETVTLREVQHPSMKAWPHRQECRGHDPAKKESVALMKLALWQSVHRPTVKDSVQCIES